MDKYTIYPDVQIAKRRRAHATSEPDELDQRWHSDLATCLQEALDGDFREIYIVGENVTYEVTITGVSDTVDYREPPGPPEAPDDNPSQET